MAKKFLHRVENETVRIGLHVNAKKTKVMTFNLDLPNNKLKLINACAIKEVQKFKYLEGWMESSEKDIAYRKALTWSACHKLRTVWSSSLSSTINLCLFQSTVESVLLYNSSTWTLTKRMEKCLDVTYMRMLRMVKGVSWKDHMINQELYGDLPKITDKITASCIHLAGHCMWHPEELASHRGRKPTGYIDNITRDTGLSSIEDITAAMKNWGVWNRYFREARSEDRPK